MSKEYVRLSIEEVMNIASEHMEEDAVHAQVVLDFAADIEKEVASRCRAQGGNTSHNTTQAAANKAAEEGGLHDAAIAAAEEWANAEFFHAKNLGAGGPGAAERCNKAEIACRTAINELAADRASRQDELTFTVDGVVMSALEYIDFLHDQRASRQVANKAEVEPEPFGYVKFRAAQRITAEGDVDANEWYEFCEQGELGDDKLPAFPLYATPPATTGASTWHDALLAECMKVEACYYADDPARTVKDLIDWYAQEASGVAEGIKVMADNYMKLTCGAGASTVLTDERLKEIWRGLVYDMSVRAKDMPITFARAIEREVAAQAGQVAVPIYQIQYVDEKGSSIWHDSTEEAYHTFVLARRRIVYAAPSPAKE